MDIRALLFDVNGTLIDIETDDGLAEIYRGIGHFLAYQGISLHRWEVRDLYFRLCSNSVRKVPRRSWSGMPLKSGASSYKTRQVTTPALCPRKARATSAVPGGTAPRHCPQATPSLSPGARNT